MQKSGINLISDQAEKFSGYISLDLINKLYQLKSIDLINRYFRKRKNARILELGCADGGFLELLSQRTSSQPFGIDISPVSVKIARRRGIKASVRDLSQKLPYPDNSFDLVIALEVIEHLFDTDFFLSEINRVTKKRGLLILSTPNLASLSNRLKLLLGFYPKYLEYSRDGAGHLHLYTPRVLSSQLQRHRFKIVKLTSPNFFCPFITKNWFPHILKKLAMDLGDVFPTLGSHLLVVAKK